MTEAYRRHDITDQVWALLQPHLPGREGTWGGVAKDNRQFINAVFWILRTGTRRREAAFLRRLTATDSDFPLIFAS